MLLQKANEQNSGAMIYLHEAKEQKVKHQKWCCCILVEESVIET
jgi:hypothetical protein